MSVISNDFPDTPQLSAAFTRAGSPSLRRPHRHRYLCQGVRLPSRNVDWIQGLQGPDFTVSVAEGWQQPCGLDAAYCRFRFLTAPHSAVGFAAVAHPQDAEGLSLLLETDFPVAYSQAILERVDALKTLHVAGSGVSATSRGRGPTSGFSCEGWFFRSPESWRRLTHSSSSPSEPWPGARARRTP